MGNLLTKVICKLLGRHLWDSVHGYDSLPNWSAKCTRCGMQYESYEEFEAKRLKDEQ